MAFDFKAQFGAGAGKGKSKGASKKKQKRGGKFEKFTSMRDQANAIGGKEKAPPANPFA
jgi:hypothetical protein